MDIWILTCLWALSIASVHAAVPDKSKILEQLQKNGACCTALNYFLPGKVAFNAVTDTKYQSSLLSYWSAQEQSLHPTCIVIPTVAQDVSTAVTILSIAYQASVAGCKFAIRGAGHTPHPGAANIEGGVTIDMQSLNQVVVSQDRKTVGIGSGNRWGNVYGPLDDQNLVMVGGRASTVGAGGLITGGGVSYFSGRYGFAADNIASFEVVLANGTLTTASSNTNPTLYKALKGGNNNLGVVTQFNAKVYPQKEFWGGFIFQPITNKNAIFEYFSNFTVSVNYDEYSALITGFAWVAGAPLISINAIYTNGDATWPPPVYAALDAMPKISSSVRKAKLSSFTNELAETSSVTNYKNNLFATLSIINKPDITVDALSEIYDLANIAQAELLTVVGLVFTLNFQPLPRKIYSKSAATGGNVLGLDRFQDDLINMEFTISWQLPTDNARVKDRIKKLNSDIEALAKEEGVFNEFIYLNYAGDWQDPIASYGAANREFLRSVSRKVDPQGVFQRSVPGGFKLGI